MPGPGDWTPQDFTEATTLLSGNKLTDVQRARLQAAVEHYQQTSGDRTSFGHSPRMSESHTLPVTADAGPKAIDLANSLGLTSSRVRPLGGEIRDEVKPSTGVQSGKNVSRETDPFAEFAAQTKAIVGSAPKPPPPGQEPPGALETFGSNANNSFLLGMGDSAGAYEAANALGMDPAAGQEIAQQAKARRLAGNQDSPLAAAAGEFTGSMLSPINIALGALGGMGGRAVGAAGKLGRALEVGGAGALASGAQGAAMAPEGHRLQGAAVGTALGAAMGPLAAYVGDPIAGFLGKQASKFRLRSATATAGDVAGMVDAKGSGAVDTLAKTLEDEGMIAGTGGGPGGSGPATSAGLLDKAHQVLAEEGPKIRALSNQTQRRVNVSAAGVELAQRAAEFNATGLPEGKRIAHKLMENALPLIHQPQRNFENALNTRRLFDGMVQRAGQAGEYDSVFANAMKVGVAKMHELIDEAAQAEGPEFHQALTTANRRFSAAKYLKDWASGGIGKEVSGTAPTGHLRFFPGVIQQTNAAIAPTLRSASNAIPKVPEFAPQMGASLFDRFFVPADDPHDSQGQ